MTSVKILIVEDSEAKLASVVSALKGVLPECNLDYAKSVKTAIIKIKNHDFTLIVADMSLPTFDVKSRERGGTARPFGGIEVFDYLNRLKKVIPTIVVSSYPAIVDEGTSLTLHDLAKKLRNDYPATFSGYVFFDSAYLTWENELKALVLKIVNNE